jgi:hypothetical protein
MSTSIATVPVDEDILFAAVITIEKLFTDDLSNQSSEGFRQLADQLANFLNDIYSNFPGFVRAVVLSFSNGSVVAETRLIFENNSTVTAENITNTLENANVTGNNTLNITDVNVARIESTLSSSSSVYIAPSTLLSMVVSPLMTTPGSSVNIEASQSLSLVMSSSMIASLSSVDAQPSQSPSMSVSGSSADVQANQSSSIVISPSISIIVSSVDVQPSQSPPSSSSTSALQSESHITASTNVEPNSNPSSSIFSSSVEVKPSQAPSVNSSLTDMQPSLSASVFSSSIDVQPSQTISISNSIASSPSVVLSASVAIAPSSSQLPSTSSLAPVTTSSVTAPTTPRTIPTIGTIRYAVVITIDQNFNSDLENRNSQAFKDLEKQFIDFLTPFYQNSRGFIIIIVNSFTKGSVVADIDVVFNSTEATTTVQQIEEPIVRAQSSGSGPFTIVSVKVAERGVDDDDDGLETWMIALIVCLAVAFVVLFVVSLLVSTQFSNLIFSVSILETFHDPIFLHQLSFLL